jgi:hypothetical protein
MADDDLDALLAEFAKENTAFDFAVMQMALALADFKKILEQMDSEAPAPWERARAELNAIGQSLSECHDRVVEEGSEALARTLARYLELVAEVIELGARR